MRSYSSVRRASGACVDKLRVPEWRLSRAALWDGGSCRRGTRIALLRQSTCSVIWVVEGDGSVQVESGAMRPSSSGAKCVYDLTLIDELRKNKGGGMKPSDVGAMFSVFAPAYTVRDVCA